MTSDTIYHYVYRITNLINNKHYYGKRSSKIEAKLDLGLKYHSSCQLLKEDIKKYGIENFKFKIIKQKAHQKMGFFVLLSVCYKV